MKDFFKKVLTSFIESLSQRARERINKQLPYLKLVQGLASSREDV